MGRREAGAQIDMHNRIVFVGKRGQKINVLANADGCGGAQSPSRRHMGKNLSRCDGNIVLEAVAVFDNGKGRQGNVVFFGQRLGQVAGTVGNDFNIHIWHLNYVFCVIGSCFIMKQFASRFLFSP